MATYLKPKEITLEDLREAFQEEGMQRTRHVSHFSTEIIYPQYRCISKLHHALNVTLLGLQSIRHPEFRPFTWEILLALAWHDRDSTFCTHLGSRFMRRRFGLDHEDLAVRNIPNSRCSDIARKVGARLDIVCQLILGKCREAGNIVHFPLDLDNSGGIFDFNRSLGLDDGSLYSPHVLADALRQQPGSADLYLEARAVKHLAGWQLARDRAFTFVNSSRNMPGQTMLLSALNYADMAEELPLPFYSLTDREGVEFLRERCNGATRTLISQALAGNFYVPVLLRKEPTGLALERLVRYPNYEGHLAERVAEWGVPREAIATFVGRDKRYRNLDRLPIRDEDGNRIPCPEAPCRTSNLIAIYVDPAHLPDPEFGREELKEKIEGILMEDSERLSSTESEDDLLPTKVTYI